MVHSADLKGELCHELALDTMSTRSLLTLDRCLRSPDRVPPHVCLLPRRVPLLLTDSLTRCCPQLDRPTPQHPSTGPLSRIPARVPSQCQLSIDTRNHACYTQLPQFLATQPRLERVMRVYTQYWAPEDAGEARDELEYSIGPQGAYMSRQLTSASPLYAHTRLKTRPSEQYHARRRQL